MAILGQRITENASSVKPEHITEKNSASVVKRKKNFT
jgi:hypothetical protein